MENTNWNIDLAHSGISFTVSHMVFAKVRGRFANWSGMIHLDQEDPLQSYVKVEIDAGSIDTGVADRDAHLRSGDFLDADSFPTLSFRSTGVEAVEGSRYRILGELTIRDVTRPVVLDTEYAGTGKDPWGNQRAAFSATTSINRKDFGLTWNQALEAGGLLVGDRIDIELDLQAMQAAAAVAA